MEDREQNKQKTGRELRQTLLKADRMLEMALMLPVSVVVGWLIGVGLDRWLHQHWIYMAGIFVGIGAGFVQIFRLMGALEGEVKAQPGASADGDGGRSQASAADGRIQKEPK